MSEADNLSQAEEHLRQVWQCLLQERQASLARQVEGVLAELTDEALNATDRIKGAAREWARLAANPRGLQDFSIWREDENERLSLNRAFDAHRQELTSLLAEAGEPPP